MTFQIVTDSCCDLPYELLEKNGVDYISMTIKLDTEDLIDDLGKSFDYQYFLDKIAAGSLPSTSQVNIGQYIEFFRPYVEKNIPVLYLAFSSGLSGSYNSAKQAVEMLQEEYSEVKVHVIDTKEASLGEGLIVYELIQLKAAGYSLDECLSWWDTQERTIQSWVTVDDLKHLERGGRISKAAATIGNLMNVKPIITVDRSGKLKNVGKMRGKKNALKKLATETVKGIIEPSKQVVFIAYAGDIESAKFLKELIEAAIRVKEVHLYPMGPTITSHTGSGCIAVFSQGRKR